MFLHPLTLSLFALVVLVIVFATNRWSRVPIRLVLWGMILFLIVFRVDSLVAQTAEITASPTNPLPVTIGPSNSLLINIGTIFGEVLKYAEGLIVIVLGFLVKKYVPQVAQQWLTNEAIEKAVHYGISAVAGATKDMVLDTHVTNGVITHAVGYLETFYPDLAKRFGDQIEAAIMARLAKVANLGPDVTAQSVGATLRLTEA